MRKLIVKQLDYDLTPVAGLVMVGHDLQSLHAQFKRMDAAHAAQRRRAQQRHPAQLP